MIIKKVKLGGGKIAISYLKQNNEGGMDEVQVKSAEKPVPEFHNSFKSLSPGVAKLCQLPIDLAARTGVSSVNYSEHDVAMNVKILATVLQDGFSFDIKLDISITWEEWTDKLSRRYSKEMLNALNEIRDRSEGYVNGIRAQMNLFEEKEVA